MPILKFRHQEADELEARAKAQAEVRQREYERMQAGTDLLPPPGAELLGSWFVIEESIVMKRLLSGSSSVEFEIFDFQTVAADGTVTGITFAQGKNIFRGSTRSGRVRAGMRLMKINGQITAPRAVRFMQIPSFGGAYKVLSLITGPHVSEGTWNDYEMTGYMYCGLTGATMDFRAVKLDPDQ